MKGARRFVSITTDGYVYVSALKLEDTPQDSKRVVISDGYRVKLSELPNEALPIKALLRKYGRHSVVDMPDVQRVDEVKYLRSKLAMVADVESYGLLDVPKSKPRPKAKPQLAQDEVVVSCGKYICSECGSDKVDQDALGMYMEKLCPACGKEALTIERVAK